MSVKKAFLITSSEKYINIIIQLITTMILARLISPEDYGLFTICMFFVGTANIIKELGVGDYLIKEKEINTIKLNNCFSLSIMVALFLAVTLFISAPFIASFYNNDKLSLIIMLLSANIIISPFGTITKIIHTRNLNYKPIAITSVISQVTSSIAMVVMAENNYGVMSLVYGSIILTVTDIIIIQFFKPKDLKLKLQFNEIKTIFNYSKFTSGSSFIYHLNQNLIELITGKYYNLHEVGIIGRASSTAALFSRLLTDSLNSVLTPYFSLLNRENTKETNNKIFEISQLYNTISLPFFLILAILSEYAVQLLYGEKWTAVSYFLMFYCIDRLISGLAPCSESILHGLGEAKPVFKLNLITNILKIFIIISTIQFGLNVMVPLVCIIPPLFGLTLKIMLYRNILSINPIQYLINLIKPFIISILCIIPLAAHQAYYAKTNNIDISLIISIMISLLIYLYLIIKTKSIPTSLLPKFLITKQINK